MSNINRDDIAELIEIQGVYDGVSAYHMKDGTYVNRWAATLEDWPGDAGIQRRFERTEEWIAKAVARESGATP